MADTSGLTVDAIKVNDSLTELAYSTHFSDLNGHITNEVIVCKSLSIPWQYAKSQIKYEETYVPTDSVINQLENPISKGGKTRDFRISSKTTSGYLYKDNFYWIHPFKSIHLY